MLLASRIAILLPQLALMFIVKHIGRTVCLQLTLKPVSDIDTLGGRRGVETTVEQVLMRGLVTA